METNINTPGISRHRVHLYSSVIPPSKKIIGDKPKRGRPLGKMKPKENPIVIDKGPTASRLRPIQGTLTPLAIEDEIQIPKVNLTESSEESDGLEMDVLLHSD